MFAFCLHLPGIETPFCRFAVSLSCMILRVVIVQSEMKSAQPLVRYFTQRGDEVWQAWELGQAWALVGQVKPNLMLMDLHFASSEWINFLRRVRQMFPDTRIIITNKYPDMQREMLVRDQNVQVFLRQPFSTRWIEQAMGRLDEDTQPVHIRRTPGEARKKPQANVLPSSSRHKPVRVPVWVKIILPYLLISLLFALSGVYLGSRVLPAGSLTPLEIAGLVILGLLLVLLVGLFLANQITRPLLRLVDASSQIAEGNLEVKVDARGNDEVAALSQSFNYMIAGMQEGVIHRDLLGRTVSPESREQLRQMFTSGSLHLEGQQAIGTVLMTNIHGFRAVLEKADPPAVFQWLNEYFAQIVPIVTAHGGVVNRLDGDMMLAFFGILPRMLSPKQSAMAACQAALEMQEALEKSNRLRARRGEPALITGIGINTGVVMAGGLGTADHLRYTIMGETVNIAQQIEMLTREVLDCSGVLISQSTYAALSGAQVRYQLEPLGEHALMGKQEPVEIYRLLAAVADGAEE